MNPALLKIEKLRKKKGVTKKHIALHCNKTPAWYGDISLGRKRIYLDDIFLIAEALEVEPKIFFDFEVSDTHNSKNSA